MIKSINLQNKKKRTAVLNAFLFSNLLLNTALINIKLLNVKKFFNLKTQQ